jgi:colanic acid/amylovoran biosynthesis protein
MKKILILHAENTFNNGSFMMLINLIYYLSKEIKEEIIYFIETKTKADMKRIKKEIPEANIKRFEEIKMGNILSKIKNLMHYGDDIKRHLNPDAIIILGGDDISEYYSKRWIPIHLFKIKKLNDKTKTFLVGQTIGPFTSYRKHYAKKILKDCNIYIRDGYSFEYIKKELKIKNAFKSSDLAFLDLPSQKNKIKIKNNPIKKDYITIIPSGLFKEYSKNKKAYIDFWTKTIEKLIKINKKKIVIMPHVTRPLDTDDREIIKELQKNINKKEIVYINKELLPSEARQIIGNGILTITSRMHPAISSFQMGKPAISISYSVKYKGIIKKDLGLKELLIEAKENHMTEEEIEEEIIKKTNYVLNNYKSIQKKIKKNVNTLKVKSLEQIKDIAKKII